MNSATFWSEGFYRPTSVGQLTNLAAHLVCTAGRLNPAVIRGLEIVVCKADGIYRLPDGHIRALQEQSTAWDADIGEMIVGKD